MKKSFIYTLTLLCCVVSLSAEKEFGKAVWAYIDGHRDLIVRYEKEGGKLPNNSTHYLNFVKYECELYDKETKPEERGLSRMALS